jgi:putative nucleotidyltransferase with HDIG domain
MRADHSGSMLRLYVRVLALIGAVVLVRSVAVAVHTPPPAVWLLFAALAFLTGSFKLAFASKAASISVADTFFITSVILFGPETATIAIAIDSFIICFRRKDPWHRIAFNVSASAISLWVAAQVFFVLSRVAPLMQSGAPIGRLIGPMVALTAVYFLLNSGLTATAVALESSKPALALWRGHFLWLSIGYFGAASVAYCLVLVIQQGSFTAAALILPLVAVFHLTLRSSFGRLEDADTHIAVMDRLYLSTVETLAMAIDAKDDVTHNHVRRVQEYAMALAHAMGVLTTDDDVKALKAAALLHDTGKLAVPEHILNKPGSLTAAEFDKMKLHVDVGADILSLVDFPFPVVPIVRAHHESWDGSGYPRGLKGTEIPIAARILSVVDCFDALTSDRPYRGRMTDAAALQILRERSGRMYDPAVVDAFTAIYASVDLSAADAPAHRQVMERLATARQKPDGDNDRQGVEAGSASTEMLAFVSLARLASGDGAVADVLALTSNLIRRIVPDATAAWYLLDQMRDCLVVAEVCGPASDAVRGLSIDVGQKITGWVAANRQIIINSAAAIDLGAGAESLHPPLTSCLSVPLLTGATLMGVLTLYGRETFDEGQGRLVEMLAPHVAVALHAARSRAVVKDEAVPASQHDRAALPAYAATTSSRLH